MKERCINYRNFANLRAVGLDQVFCCDDIL